jgi:hypothetical protein
MDRSIAVEGSRAAWAGLYQAGGAAPLVAALLYLSQFLILLSGETYPATPQGWFALFQRSRILGLFFLNALDIISISLLGVMFVALYVALSRSSPSSMAIAAFFAFLGVAVFVSSRADMVSATRSLSEEYAAAITEAQRSQIVASRRAIHATSRATPETIGFLLIAVGSAITSAVILRSGVFSRVAGYLGLLAGAFTLANDLSIVAAPSLAAVLMPVNGLLWLVWWLMIGRGLLRLARGASKARP